MLYLCAVSALALTTPFHARRLSEAPVGKYPPGSDVVDHANIDLDQAALQDAIGSLTASDVTAVKAVYEGGQNSKPFFTCTLPTVTTAVADGAALTYTDTAGVARTATVDGTVLATTDTDATIKAKYTDMAGKTLSTTPTIHSIRIDATQPIVLSAGGAVGTCTAGTVVNGGGRTLQGFSTKVQNYMIKTRSNGGSCPDPVSTRSYRNGCPYSSALPYYNYHCATARTGTGTCHTNGDYANQYVLAALDLTATNFDHFNINFGAAPANEPTLRKDFIKKTTAYSNAWMYAIREFEDAIDDCTIGDLTSNALSDGPVHAWDEGVAFYVGGSLLPTEFYDATSGLEKAPTDAYLAYTLANKRCKNFKTCGRSGDLATGEAYVNFELWKSFSDGQDALVTGNCAGLVPIKNHIMELMTVPLIQGTLRYANYCDSDKDKSCTAKAVGELAAFATAIAPQVHACSATAAATLAAAANPNSFTCTSATVCKSTVTSYSGVKAALEGCYSAMGATCKLVGGLYDSSTLMYDSAPCSDASTVAVDDGKLKGGAIAGIAIGAGAALILLLVVCCLICKEKSGQPVFAPMSK